MPSLSKESILTGLASALAFFVVIGLGLGSFFLFFPTLPLFMLGLHTNARQVAHAAAVAALTVAIISGVAVGGSFAILISIPAWYIIHLGMKRIANDAKGQPQWLPIGYIFSLLCVFACAVMGLVTFYYALMPVNLPTMIATYVRTAFEPLKDQFGDNIELLAVNWSFLTLGITLWVWGLALYAHLWFAHFLLARKGKGERASVAITPFTMPAWMLSLLGICALASLIGGESAQFIGKSLLIVLALPYFFLGIALIHQSSQQWPNRKIFLFILYFMMFAQLWPVMLVSGIGLWHQVKNLNKHLPVS